MERKIKRIPLRLNSEFQLAGFTIFQLIIFIATLFFGFFFTAAGKWPALFVPSVYFVIHMQIPGDGRRVRELLKIRLRYLKKEQSYGMQDCERRLKKKK